jgi:peroxiredoxin Q/BCP
MAAKKKSRTKTKAKSVKKGRTKAKARTKARPARKPKMAARRRMPAAASMPKAGIKSLPAVEVATTSGKTLRLAELRGKPVVIYFYPKDDTPGCTTEGCDIRDNWGAFTRLDAVVLGVSRDSLASHERFKAKFGFPFELVSDEDEKLCKLFDVIREKSLYGKKYMGVDRSTFVFDRGGALRREWRGVKVPGHVQEVLAEVQKL